MSDTKVDTETLRTAGNNLREVATAFEKAEDYADEYADNCGDRGLRDALQEFADSWDESRSGIRDSMDGLGEFAKKAAKKYEDIEDNFVNTLIGENK